MEIFPGGVLIHHFYQMNHLKNILGKKVLKLKILF